MEEELGFVQPVDDGLHDNFYITSIMMVTDPTVVRYEQRVEAGETLINGVDIHPKERAIEVGSSRGSSSPASPRPRAGTLRRSRRTRPTPRSPRRSS